MSDVHYVRDFSFDEDRFRVRNGKLPRNLACLSNAAIALVRMRGRFRHQPQTHRHYAAKQARPCGMRCLEYGPPDLPATRDCTLFRAIVYSPLNDR